MLHQYRRRRSEGNLIKVTPAGREYEGFSFLRELFLFIQGLLHVPIRSHKKVNRGSSGEVEPRAVSLTRVRFSSPPPIFLRRPPEKSLCNARTPIIFVPAWSRLAGIN